VMVADAERPQAFLRCLAGERAQGIAAFTDAVTLMTEPPGGQGDKLRARLVVSFMKSTGIFEKDRTFYLDAMSTNVAAASLPYPDRIKVGQQARSVPPRFCIISGMLLAAISRTFTREADATARLRAAQTALAVERFRRGHGETLPTRLEELAPGYCKSVPTDPYDGNPLRFKTLDSGYVIYSIGSDGKDDGGVERDAKNFQAPHDITFKVER